MLSDNSINCCVTSPPYWNLRDYGVSGQIGLEPTPEEYVTKMVEVFNEVKRVLRQDGTLWLNLGDCYTPSAPGTMEDNIHIEGTKEATKRARKIMRPQIPKGLKPKDLIGIPWRVAFALQQNGWYLRSDIIWHKPNPMPESVRDRPTKSHEYIFLLSKSKRYYYDYDSIKEPSVYVGPNTGVGFGHGMDKEIRNRDRVRGSEGVLTGVNSGRRYKLPTGWDTNKGSHGSFHKDGRRSGNIERKYGENRDRPGSHLGSSIPWEGNTRNKRSVWSVSTQAFPEAHFATFPEKLIEPCILAGCPENGIVLDPFMGSGTTARVSYRLRRNYIGFELNPEYIKIAEKRLYGISQQLFI